MLFMGSIGFDQMAIIGLPAFQGRYITHNMDDHYMEFGPLVGSTTPDIFAGTRPTRSISEAGKPNQLTVYSLLIVYGGLCYALYLYQVGPRILSRSGYIGTRAGKDSTDANYETTFEIYLLYGNLAYFLFCLAIWQLYVSPMVGVYQPGLISLIFSSIYNTATA